MFGGKEVPSRHRLLAFFEDEDHVPKTMFPKMLLPARGSEPRVHLPSAVCIPLPVCTQTHNPPCLDAAIS